jgi:hypothetical protein
MGDPIEDKYYRAQEPGTFTGTVFEDVTPIKGNGTRLAVRLCNFPTRFAAPTDDHMKWIDRTLVPTINSLQTAWVDLIGWASKLGDPRYNDALSLRRCDKVREYIKESTSRAKFNVQWPKGSSESLGAATNNDGWWRAVEVFLYGFKPPTVTPVTVVGSTHFKIRCLGTGSFTLSKYGTGVSGGAIVFEIVDKEASESAIFVHDLKSISIGIPGFPDVSFADAGDWKDFETSVRAELYDFQGKATVYQDPGFQVGSLSAGGTMSLQIDSNRLLALGAYIRGGMLRISTGDGFSAPSIGIGFPGHFKMIGTTRSFP